MTTTTTTTTKTTKAPKGMNAPNPPNPPRNGPDTRPRAATSTTATQGSGAKRPDHQPRYSVVNLRVHEIHCISTTKEILNKDDIVLAAVKVEGRLGGTNETPKLVARAEKGEQLSAGKFAKGDKQTYPKTRVLATYDAGGPIGPDPRAYFGALVLMELDTGKTGEVIESAVSSVEKEAAGALSTAAAGASAAVLAGLSTGAAMGSVVPIVGTAICAAVGSAVGLAIGEISAARADDVFPLKMVKLELDRFPDEPGEIEKSRQTLDFKAFKAHYRVIVSWAVR